jgi:poly(A) polymerase
MVSITVPKMAGLDRLIAVLGGPQDTRLIGGAVRDTMLEQDVSDIDLATRLLPDDVLARLKTADIKAIPTGLAHGTITAILASKPIEITTLRRDVETDGRHAIVAFTDDWQADAARRDFTINAMSADPDSGAVHDYFGGVDDLKAGRVCFIGEPLARIAEDHLRILRFFRFHARFGRGQPDAAGYAACVARANDLMALSRERIAAEILKLLACADPVPTVSAMLSGGILKAVLPEITSADGLAHLIMREAASGHIGDPKRRLAALIGPDPACATRIAARLKLSKAQAKRLSDLCDWPHRADPRADAYRIGMARAIDRILLSDVDLTALKALDNWTQPVLPIGGGALIARGLSAGPIVAATLVQIERDWIAAGFPSGDTFERIVERALLSARA